MRAVLELDGAQGEGGGQIVRTALGLSLATGTPFRVRDVRAGRTRPGLLRQHLTAVEAARRLSRAEVDGAEPGSRTLTFRPGPLRSGAYAVAVGTAGSATLVFQAVLPGLLRAAGPVELVIEGGTHNPAAPPAPFLLDVFLPLLRRMGGRVELTLERAGFAPAGGGRLRARTEPGALAPLFLGPRRPEVRVDARAIVANLPSDVARRELAVVAAALQLGPDRLHLERVDAAGPGNVVLVRVDDGDVVETFAAFGEKGVPAEAVAARATGATLAHLATSAPVGEHLADQLVLLLALAGGGSFRTSTVSRHLLTQREVIEAFLPVRVALDAPVETASPGQANPGVTVRVTPQPSAPGGSGVSSSL